MSISNDLIQTHIGVSYYHLSRDTFRPRPERTCAADLNVAGTTTDKYSATEIRSHHLRQHLFRQPP
jgi:hypothetical protein